MIAKWAQLNVCIDCRLSFIKDDVIIITMSCPNTDKESACVKFARYAEFSASLFPSPSS